MLAVGCLALLAARCSDSGSADDDGAGDTGASSAPASRTPTVTQATVSDALPDGFTLASNPTIDYGALGYEQVEYLLDGLATAHVPAGPLSEDGKWIVTAGEEAPYTTRVVVTRPVDPEDFNGTALVEWLNVSGGVDASPDLTLTHVELTRSGYVHVAVSAQQVGLDATRTADPERYASLSHPGDSYSYDIFSQAGQAVRLDADELLGGLQPERVIAIGESQSAIRMTTYINAVHPVADVYDGFLVHSRYGRGGALSQAPLEQIDTPPAVRIRTDLDVPVLVFQTETDTDALQARQDDSDVYRLWEVAGTAHFDSYGLALGATDEGDEAGATAWFDAMRAPSTEPIPGFTCALPVNAGPQTYVLRAAVVALSEWVATGTPPPSAPRLEVVSTDPTAPEYAVDEQGITLGGIRTPAVDAPVAVLRGLGQPAGSADSLQRFCRLFGTTVPLTTEQLTELYPDHDAFVAAWEESLDRAVEDGYVLEADAELLRSVAENAAVPS
ncbi:hypothetical protein SAMN05660991_03645 [Trujillonella endophytica]|uniref:Alpha/beta hydrolase domain-containing protein n=1 Tax=Trujillonella endophytica TaxID=673521 RepID=A0A1H8VN26_9ACTN|nr:hypothetical protein SAMN05660991_03645 [Trujillella endophytica]